MTGDPMWASGEATSHWQNQQRTGTPFTLQHEGFTLSGLNLRDGPDGSLASITNIETQDPKHCVKKLFSWLVVGPELVFGLELATHTPTSPWSSCAFSCAAIGWRNHRSTVMTARISLGRQC